MHSAFDSPWPLAGFWLRAMAVMIDTVILLFASFVLLTIGLVAGIGLAFLQQAGWPLALLLALVYAIAGEASRFGATPGKLALGLRVVNSYGDTVNPQRVLTRNCGKLLSVATMGIGFLMVAFTASKQSLHDKLADTLVIRTR